MAVSDGSRIVVFKDMGLVSQVFNEGVLESLQGFLSIGHTRYSTTGASIWENAQPTFRTTATGHLALGHNGNLTNTAELVEELFNTHLRHINTDSDSEVLLNVFAHELARGGKVVPDPEDVFDAVAGVHRRCRGGYAAVVMLAGYGVVGFRDRNGIRPLIFGSRMNNGQKEYMIASESVALDSQGFAIERDVAPGEAVYVDVQGRLFNKVCIEPGDHTPCIFEHVYFARPDSLMDSISVYKARLRMGEKLADKLRRLRPDHDIDVVIPTPDTSRTAALELANRLGLKYREGFVKNRYIGRTFIMPGQSQRRKSVRQKLNAIELEFKGKNVLLVDDSIVRGTTCKQIIQMARDAGARKVYFASAAPAIRYPNVYGIDMPAASELIASGKTDAEVEKLIGADWLIFQDLQDLIDSAAEGNPRIKQFECSVFDGEYITGDVNAGYLEKLEQSRCDTAKEMVRKSHYTKENDLFADLHNEG